MLVRTLSLCLGNKKYGTWKEKERAWGNPPKTREGRVQWEEYPGFGCLESDGEIPSFSQDQASNWSDEPSDENEKRT